MGETQLRWDIGDSLPRPYWSIPMSVVVALGSFNLVNSGHLRALHAAKRSARRLVIAVATDELVEQRTGETPNVGVEDRVELLEAFFPEAQVEVAASDDVAALLERFGADALAVSSTDADVAPVSGVRMLGIDVDDSTPSLRNRREEVLWLPRCG